MNDENPKDLTYGPSSPIISKRPLSSASLTEVKSSLSYKIGELEDARVLDMLSDLLSKCDSGGICETSNSEEE